MATQSPRRRTPKAAAAAGAPASPAASPLPFSPTRITRQEEQQELQDLNKRLETYILKQRERDASQDTINRELEAVRENANAELKRAHDLYASQLGAIQEQADLESQERAKAEARSEELAAELQRIQEEADATRERDVELQEQNEDLQKQLDEKSREAQKLRDELSQLKAQFRIEHSRCESLQKEVDDARARAQDALSELGALRSKSNGAEQVLATFRQNMDYELQQYRNQVAQLTAQNARIEEETRRIFAEQMAELLEERQQKHDADKDQALAMLKAVYDEKIAAYRDHLERAGHELEMLRNQKAAVDASQAAIRSREEEFETTTVTLKRSVKELEEQLQAERDRPKQQLAQKNEIIRRLKASFKRKDEEFDELMDLKIALAMEIKQYRELLEEEEERIGYVSGKKRKRADGSSAMGESKYEDATETLLISGMDREGEYINIRNGATRPISLRGWTLQSRVGVFSFPNQVTLKPGQSITVHTGPGAEEKESLPSSVAWKGAAPWDPAGDEAVLMSPEGEEVARVEILPTSPLILDDADSTQQAGAQQGQNCIVM